MLITNNIWGRFDENLTWATEIDIATAWATCSWALDNLRQKVTDNIRFQVRAIVGISGNNTEPEALRRLNKIGELRIASKDPLFHPKAYIFRSNSKSVAWIGSANFTFSGFGRNKELMFETLETNEIKDWFEELWQQCDSFQTDDIDKYEKSRRLNLPRPQPQRPELADVRNFRDRIDLFMGISDWKSYILALEKCNHYWDCHHDWSVLGETDSWSHTIQVLNDVVKMEWSTLNDYCKQRLLGLTNNNWALLGSMRPSAHVVFDQNNRERIQNIVMRITNADDDKFPDVAITAYEELMGIDGVGKATATRLLALARPDRIVSLNGASEGGLARSFGLARTTLGIPNNYRFLLERLYEKRWFQALVPKDSGERTIWSMRAALVDCFVYERSPLAKSQAANSL